MRGEGGQRQEGTETAGVQPWELGRDHCGARLPGGYHRANQARIQAMYGKRGAGKCEARPHLHRVRPEPNVCLPLNIAGEGARGNGRFPPAR